MYYYGNQMRFQIKRWRGSQNYFYYFMYKLYKTTRGELFMSISIKVWFEKEYEYIPL